MPEQKRLVLVPYCIASINCEAGIVQDELMCKRDGCAEYEPMGCRMYDIFELAEKKSVKVRIVWRDEEVPRILAEEKPDVVLGMVCRKKEMELTSQIGAMGIEYNYAILRNYPCRKDTGIPSYFSLAEYRALLDGEWARRTSDI